MESLPFIHDLAVVLLAAGLAALLSERLRQPKILGYILAGLVIGPHLPLQLIQNEASIRTLGDLGIIVLMFSFGLNFSLPRLRRVGPTALVTGTLDVVTMLWIGYLIGRSLGWGFLESLLLGAVICDSSTTLMLKIFNDLGKRRKKFAEIALGVTVVEDLLAIVLIALLNGVAVTGNVHTPDILYRLAGLTVFLVSFTVVGLLVVPRFMSYASRTRNDELILLLALGLCFGIALLAVQLKFSLALGAFLMGMVMAEARNVYQLEVLVAPIRHMFSAIFFVTVGLLIQPARLPDLAGPVLAVTGVVILGKTITNTAGVFLMGHGARDALLAGLSLAQICEFSFIIAAMGLALGATDPDLYQIAVVASVLTIVLNAQLVRQGDRIAAWAARHLPERLAAGLRTYTRWIENIGTEHRTSPVTKVIRRSMWIIAINAFLIAGGFIAAGYLARSPPAWSPAFLAGLETRKEIYWLGTLVLTLPLYVATLRKLWALGMIFAEIRVPADLQTSWASSVRTMITYMIFTAGCLGLILLTSILSSTFLPSWKPMLLMLALIALITVWAWRSLVKIYARAQNTLQEMFQKFDPAGFSMAASAPRTLQDINLETLLLPKDSPLAGQPLADSHLRKLTGCSVVGIERNDEKLLNPTPDICLCPGDRILLLGNPDQIRAATELLAGAPAPGSA